jgi:hypothetical protein
MLRRVPHPLVANDLVIGLLTENISWMLAQAVRLVRSIRWFGGELANARIVVCGVGALEPVARDTLRSLGAEIRTVSRFHPANPTGNRHQLIGELLDAPEEMLLLLDCDTLVVQDPLPYLTRDAFQAKIAPTPTVSDEVFTRLFAHFGLPKPPRTSVTPLSGEATIPYFNAGVMAIPRDLARTLAPAWRRYNKELADRPELAAPCQRHMHQASLSLALAETGIPRIELPPAMNFQLNATHVAAPPGFAETDPVIIHYHHLASEDGALLPTTYPGAQARIDQFHERMRAEGLLPSAKAADTRASRPIAVVGMHRSGTSLVTQIVAALGVYAGQPDELAVADMFNPTGYWEHREIVALDSEILETLGASWSDALHTQTSQLPQDARERYVARARDIIERSLLGRGPFLVKDPRMSLLVPLWRDVLDDPVFIIAWRDPLAVAQSLATRDQQPRLVALAAWEHYTRTILRDTEGLARVLVSYEELLAEPTRVASALCETLHAFGVEGLRVPGAERIAQLVHPDFNRSGQRASADYTLLDAEQRALLDDLRTGAALRKTIAPTPARAREMMTAYREVDAMRQHIKDLDLLLGAVFESKSWRVGHRLTGLARVMKRHGAISARERWQEMQSRRRG